MPYAGTELKKQIFKKGGHASKNKIKSAKTYDPPNQI